MKHILSFTFSLLFCLAGNAQVFTSPESDSDTILYEKLYLHIDREMYAPGDDVWFKAYLVSGINHQPIPGFKNVYVELISEKGKIIDRRMMLSINGVSNNDFRLPDSLATGQYTIRGYTKYLLNFGEESLFHQKIAVASISDMPEYKEKTKEQKPINVAFLPEGGNLVLNTANYVAFKAIDETGRGIQVTGKITDETGQKVASFESRYRGMGTVVFMPQDGKKYYARIDGNPDFRYTFEDALPEGVAIHYQPNGNNLQFILNRNLKATSDRKLTLTAYHKGQELFWEEVQMSGFQQPVNIYKGFFPPGISKITLYDEQNNILAERLVYVRNSDDKTLKITTDKKQYQAREKINMEFESLLNAEEDSIVTGLSVAVVNDAYFSEGGRTQTIESYLLLDSELKGPLESPASLFTDEENLSAGEKLDLVMMVHGWRRYYWDELIYQFGKPLPGWDDTGLTIEGEVKTLWGNNPVAGGTVELGPFSGEFLILKDTTDAAGRFSFNRLYLKDYALVMINAFNKKGRRSVEITYEPTALFDTLVPFKKVDQGARNVELHEKYNSASFNRHLEEREFELEHGSILLDEVNVVEEYKSGPVVTGNYGYPDRGFMLTDADREEYYDIIKYLQFEVPGIFVYGEDEIRIGTSDKPPLFFVDDYSEPDLERIKFLPMEDIVKVEIIHPKTELTVDMIDVTQKNGGVISILTKTGFGSFPDEFVRNIHGRITPRVRGFRQAREFYSPAYSLAEQYLKDNPDYRPTLFWKPFVDPEKNKTTVEFYASDMSGQFRIIAEGISANGKICYSTAVFDVIAPK